jgi:hypothetical protein
MPNLEYYYDLSIELHCEDGPLEFYDQEAMPFPPKEEDIVILGTTYESRTEYRVTKVSTTFDMSTGPCGYDRREHKYRIRTVVEVTKI